jgi:hypothetical protein
MEARDLAAIRVQQRREGKGITASALAAWKIDEALILLHTQQAHDPSYASTADVLRTELVKMKADVT